MPEPRVALAGLRAAGKTSVGERLAGLLDVPFLDSDREIEALARGSAAQLIQRHGWEWFRAEERRAVRALAGRACGVLALGGGAPLDPDIRAALAGWRVFLLDAPDEVLAERMARAGAAQARPPLTELAPTAEIAELRKQRAECYLALGGEWIDTSGRTPCEIAGLLHARLLGGAAG